jgi:hypothetical protein
VENKDKSITEKKQRNEEEGEEEEVKRTGR